MESDYRCPRCGVPTIEERLSSARACPTCRMRLRLPFVSDPASMSEIARLMDRHLLSFHENNSGGLFASRLHPRFSCQVAMCDDRKDLAALVAALTEFEMEAVRDGDASCAAGPTEECGR